MIIDLQRRISEVGRIRIGQQVPTQEGSRPTKLDTFRLTSPDQRRIRQAAQLYGGTPAEWQAPAGAQWEVITTSDTLNVIVPPSDMAFSQHYELWSGGGCQRRCDGANESISQGPCLCDPERRECTPHTRLSVMLRDLPGLGVWRIDTQGFYAAVELQGAVEVVQMAAGRGHMLPARLRLEQRMVKRPGEQTKRFAVPVLDIEVSPAQLLSGGAHLDAGTMAIEPPRQQDSRAPLTPVPESVPVEPTPTVAEQAAARKERKPRKNAAQPIGRAGIKPRTAAQAAAPRQDEPPPEEIDADRQFYRDREGKAVPVAFTPEQRRKGVNMMFALFTDADIHKDNRDDRLVVTRSIVERQDIQSSDDLTDPELYRLVNTLRAWKEQNKLGHEVTEILNRATLAAEQTEIPITP